MPPWLHPLAIVSVVLGLACAFGLAADVALHPQKMKIMNVVWPVTALFGSLAVVAFYERWGARDARDAPAPAEAAAKPSLAVMAAKAAGHCGSGCTLGDLGAEMLAVWAPAVLVLVGWHTLWDENVFATWTLDFVFAYALGIVFQYFAIAPMRHLGLAAGLKAAVKADTLSLVAWQLGMYGFMAFAIFGLFRAHWDEPLRPSMPEFWFMMQLAMLCGFVTSWPVNAWLIRRGWKEAM